jgi:hypothetical protein
MRLAPWFIAAAAVVAAAYLAIRDREQQLEVGSLRAKIADFTAQSAREKTELEAKLVKADAARFGAQNPLRHAAGAPPAAIPAPLPRGHALAAIELRKDPAYAPIMHRQQLREISREYGDVFASLNLPPDKLAQLKNLMIDRLNAPADARDAAQNSGLNGADINQAAEQAVSGVNDDIKALVGADGYDELQAAQQTMGERNMIQLQVGVDLSAAGVPLSGSQTLALAQIYADARNPAKNPALAAATQLAADPAAGLAAINQAILDRATQMLSPAQLPILQQSLSDQAAQQAYFRKRAAATAASSAK